MTLRPRPAFCSLPAVIAAFALWLCAGAVQAAMYDMPAEGSDVVGKLQHIETSEEDTFVKLARRYNCVWPTPTSIPGCRVKVRRW